MGLPAWSAQGGSVTNESTTATTTNDSGMAAASPKLQLEAVNTVVNTILYGFGGTTQVASTSGTDKSQTTSGVSSQNDAGGEPELNPVEKLADDYFDVSDAESEDTVIVKPQPLKTLADTFLGSQGNAKPEDKLPAKPDPVGKTSVGSSGTSTTTTNTKEIQKPNAEGGKATGSKDTVSLDFSPFASLTRLGSHNPNRTTTTKSQTTSNAGSKATVNPQSYLVKSLGPSFGATFTSTTAAKNTGKSQGTSGKNAAASQSNAGTNNKGSTDPNLLMKMGGPFIFSTTGSNTTTINTNIKPTVPKESTNPFDHIPSKAADEWAYRKTQGETNRQIDELMTYQGLENVKQQFLAIKSHVDVCLKQRRDPKKDRYSIFFQGNLGTGEIFSLQSLILS